jgi:hypothetical protein
MGDVPLRSGVSGAACFVPAVRFMCRSERAAAFLRGKTRSCVAHNDSCINDYLYMSTTGVLASMSRAAHARWPCVPGGCL